MYIQLVLHMTQCFCFASRVEFTALAREYEAVNLGQVRS